MKPIEFELQRRIQAPIDQVFARLVDIEGHNDWMANTGSMLKHTRQTSPGEPAVGTTFVDETSQGPMPGEIAELEEPHTIVFHWWEKSKSGAQVRGVAELPPSALRRQGDAGPPSRQVDVVRRLAPGHTDLAAVRRQGAHHHDRRAQGVLRGEFELRS